MLNEGGMNVSMQDTLQALADPTRREILNATVLEEILLWISELKGEKDHD